MFTASGRLLLSRPAINHPLDSGISNRTTVVDGKRSRVVSRSTTIHGHTYRFALWRSYEEADATQAQLAKLLAALAPLFMLLSVAGGWWLSRRTLQPIDDLTSAARTVSLSKLSDRLPLPAARDELYRLCEAWNEMLGRLEESALRLKQFTADAAHELRTPTAVIRATAELALRQERETAAYRDSLVRIKEQSVEMSALIEDLLTLARSERDQIRSSFTLVDLAAIAREVQSLVQPRATAQQSDFLVACPSSPVLVLGDGASLRRLLMILIDNAFKFTPPRGRVEVKVSDSGSGEAVLEVIDTGIGISAEAMPKIYDRFFQADPSRSAPGTGLGLSLARWITSSHGATIQVESTPGEGSLFRVRFDHAEGDSSSRPDTEKLLLPRISGKPR
ncbi:MAG: sensor histidine kinase [Bryobacteraceae bacterium]